MRGCAASQPGWVPTHLTFGGLAVDFIRPRVGLCDLYAVCGDLTRYEWRHMMSNAEPGPMPLLSSRVA